MHFEQRTILVVDDLVGDLALIDSAFAKAGVKNPVVQKLSGEDACTYLDGAAANAERRPVVLITDLKMPWMDGVELVRWVRNRPVWEGMPVVMLSSSQLDDDIKRAYEVGVNIYLSKPRSFLDQVAMLRSLVEWLRFTHDSPSTSALARRSS